MVAKKTKTAELFEFPAFDMNKVADSYREMADKSLTQSKEAYAKLKAGAEDATKTMEAVMESAQAGTVELGLKAIDAARTNADNSLSHLEALLGVKSVAQMIELQTSFFRKQAEFFVDHAKAMQETGRKVAEDVAKPVKAAADKAAKDVKATAEKAFDDVKAAAEKAA